MRRGRNAGKTFAHFDDPHVGGQSLLRDAFRAQDRFTTAVIVPALMPALGSSDIPAIIREDAVQAAAAPPFRAVIFLAR
jgi:hypothetical protein